MKNWLQIAAITGIALLIGSRSGLAGDGSFDNIYVGTSAQVTGSLQVTGTESILGASSTLGIGTSTPMARLGIVGRSPYYGQATFGDANDAGYISFRRGSDGSPQGNIGYTNSATESGIFDISSNGGSGAIRFNVGGVNGAMFLNTYGKLGLGTTSPAANLDIRAGGTPAANNGSIFRIVDPGFPANASNSTQYAMGQIQFSPVKGQAAVLSIGRRGDSGDNTSTMDGNILGTLLFNGTGADAATFRKGAEISAIARWSYWGNDHWPADLAFLLNSSTDTTNLTERMRITYTGNVGIGTTTPQAKLDVVGGGKFTDVINLFNGTGASSPSIVLDPINGQILLNGQSLLAPNTSGNVGIGTTNPAYKLQVNGTTKFGDGTNVSLGGAYGLFSSASGNAGLTINKDNASQYASLDFLSGGSTATGWSIQMQPNSTALSFVDRANNATSLSILNGGKVGIGTNAPYSTLGVKGANDATGGITLDNGTYTRSMFVNSSGYLTFSRPSNPTSPALFIGGGNDELWIRSVGAGGISLHSSGPDAAIISRATSLTIGNDASTIYFHSTSGNIGIGTASPQAKLHIYNTTAASASGNEILRIGTLYDGTIPGSGGYINFTDATNTALGQIRSILEANDQVGLSFSTFSSGLTEKMRISNSGNVGIGTTTPQAKLDVNGDVKIAGAITMVKRQGDIKMGDYGTPGSGD